MQRRTFLQSGAICLLTRSLFAAPLEPAVENAELPTGASRVFSLNTGWLWSRTLSSDAHTAQCDESGFEVVTLPHSNVFVPWHSIDQTSYQFTSIYRRHFALPAATPGRRVFVDFEGVMAASRVYLNGVLLGEYAGGFTPFSFELTPHLSADDNVLSVEVDSHELPEVPPFGYEIDYLTYGGIYRTVSLRCTGPVPIQTLRAVCLDPLLPSRTLQVTVSLAPHPGALPRLLSLRAEVLDGERVVVSKTHLVPKATVAQDEISLSIAGLDSLKLWTLEQPRLYTLRVTLLADGTEDWTSTRFGVREARFTPAGFTLNGKTIKLRGLNRHQSFPYTGFAMPERVQRRDVHILKYELKCNIVRCSHYPPAPTFLDACDELGLLVIDETPGWQHVGESATWQERYLDNNRRMIQRDWNHPCVILWSIRINESRDFHALYLKANRDAHALDPTRQTTGVRYFQESELLEDVFSMNDFGFPLKSPNHPLYLNTEVVGAEYPVRPWDNNAIQREHILRYANILNQIAGNPGYAGVLGWCAFDYQTHADFGSGDHICYHGVCDTFREPKPAAGLFRSQCDPTEEAVLEPGFHFAMNDEPGGFKDAAICSNCEEIRCFLGEEETWHLAITLAPARDRFPHLAHPPFFLTLPNGNDDWADLRLDGYIAGKCVVSRRLSSRGVDQRFTIEADDTVLQADGSDATRVVLRVTDQYGARRPLCFDPVHLHLEGPAVLVGQADLALVAGHSAVWVRSLTRSGTVVLTATHPTFGPASVHLEVVATQRSAEAPLKRPWS